VDIRALFEVESDGAASPQIQLIQCVGCGTLRPHCAKSMCQQCYDAERHRRNRQERGELQRPFTCVDCGAQGFAPGKRGFVPKRCASCAASRDARRSVERSERSKEGVDRGLSASRDRMRRAANAARNTARGVAEDGEKRCPRCGQVQPVTNFLVCLSRKSGRDAYCRSCRREISAEWARANRGKVSQYSRKWKEKNKLAARLTRHRIDVDGYMALLDEQGGCCAICGTEPADPYSLHVDHDHRTGEVRGLLCVGCNSGLGKLGDTEEGLLRALDYLRKKRNQGAAG
jgi:hypothetical protein